MVRRAGVPAPDPAARRRARWIAGRLARTYGPGHPDRPPLIRRPPLDELILTVLSQNTSDVNRDRAWTSLRTAYPRWADVARARPGTIARAIAVGGLANTKAPRIIAILREIRRREGRISLARLTRMTDDEVRAYLTSLPGVGPKTAACVLGFSLGRPALPVDTHVARIGARLGFLRARDDPGRSEAILCSLIPEGDRVDAHLDLIAHGRAICTARRPACTHCPIAPRCPSAGMDGTSS